MSAYGGYVDQPIMAELYDLVPGYAKRTDIDFYVQYCVTAGGPILELGCGTGRILLPAAEAGCVTGLDISKHMLAYVSKAPTEIMRFRTVSACPERHDKRTFISSVIIPFRAFCTSA
jgi:SAM-dependent methyltransferase